ncbi:hypothetical protein [Teredinibacter turnerae]|uniref:hypothetical protein n=1 Tax=Teredinibacter turnerae TaxID=2426 RepID=UPI0003782B44|nr:hypothetical protein [Teredinibacter turnerae]
MNNTEPRTFARYIENLKQQAITFSAFLLTKDANPLAEDFPCAVCGGEGLLVKESRYKKVRGGVFFQSVHEKEIRSTELILCPCCDRGADQSAIDNYAKELAKLERGAA